MNLSARDALRWALEIETNGRAFYQSVAEKTTDRNAKLLFADLAEQESRHYRTFAHMLDRAPTATVLSEPDRRQAEAYLRSLYDNALFGGEGRGLALAETATDESSALRAAIAFEKDTLLFFHDLRDEIAPAQRAAVSAIIDEEREHLRQLGRVLQDMPWVS